MGHEMSYATTGPPLTAWARLLLESTPWWNVPEDPLVWVNPFFPEGGCVAPQQDSTPRVRWWGPEWEPIYDSAPPAVRAEFTAEDWAHWYTRARPVLSWPRSWAAWARERWVYTLLMLAAEQRATLAEQARGRIMGSMTLPSGALVEFGGNHGVQFVREPQDHSSSAVQRRHGATFRHRGRSKGRRQSENGR